MGTKRITIPELSLVVLIGPSGAGKSTFARRHFKPTEVLSSDHCRALVADDENDMTATGDAFAVLHFIAAKRLAAGRLAVIDATNVQPEARKPLLQLARQFHVLPVAIVLNIRETLCQQRNQARPDRNFGPHVVRRHCLQLRQSLGSLQREGFREIFELRSPEEVDSLTVERQPLWVDRRGDRGPFDIIGDVHGCFDELVVLLEQLGYQALAREGETSAASAVHAHPGGRKAVFLGDLTDRGPRSLDVLRLVRGMVGSGAAFCLPGNHDVKLLRWLRGRNVQVSHGLERTIAEIAALPEEEREPFKQATSAFLDGLVSHYVLDGGKLVVAHAGLREELQGRASSRVRDFALYGETSGETDEFGLPVRYNWAAEYRGKAMVVYGHTPVPEPEWLNGTINIDSGCAFGGRLTALRYPERELVSVSAARIYAEPARPFLPAATEPLTAQQRHDELLDLEDVTGTRRIATRLHGTVTIREENAVAALEVMSRFAADPRWIITLPPTMSPVATSRLPGLLEHPAEAFDTYRAEGIPHVVCEEKHMGSRAVVVVCRDAEAARSRFGVATGEAGIVLTRTGRRFFDDLGIEGALLDRLRAALDAAGFWDEFRTDWFCLDCELMPWSAKAQGLLTGQYAPVGAAARTALREAQAVLARAAARGVELADLQQRAAARAALADRYVAAYRRYCWEVASVDDLKLAPFHLLASEGAVHVDRDHAWHMETLARLCAAGDGLLLATPWRVVDLTDEASQAAATAWWEALTAGGGEGMVVKPLEFVARGLKRLVQPALKVRGPEYLRIIYGPEYDLPENLGRLRRRGLSAKRSLALREFALGIEALERFGRSEPLRRVHECVFGVLALESEPVDPRL